jgi:flavin-dependent thymidylate synthase
MPEDVTIQSRRPPTTDVERYADAAMYRAEPDPLAAEGEAVRPQVTLISMTSNPLRVMAAASQLYAGHVVRSPSDISRTVAERWLSDMTRTALQAPLEFIDLHFLLEGVTRAFTHQLVRQRTGVYVQESQRFAVKDNAALEVAMPPSIAKLNDDDPRRVSWNLAIERIASTYDGLVSTGVPAEDARGLLPTNITTRVHYKTNLRNLCEHAGMRLCTQAQYEWKQVWEGMVGAILGYKACPASERWQLHDIVSLFKPVCFRTGKCEFMADTDRWCGIRERVEAHHTAGDPPDTWSDINPLEPLQEGAARLSPEMRDYA